MKKEIEYPCHRSVYMDENIYRELKIQLATEGRTFSEFVREYINEYLKQKGDE